MKKKITQTKLTIKTSEKQPFKKRLKLAIKLQGHTLFKQDPHN
jgi:hypothetical protein